MYIFFAVGGLTMIMGFVGCWGVVKESPFLLGLYFVIVLFIMITMVIAATFIFLFSGSDTGKIFLGVCIGGIIIEITGIILSVYLCQNIKIGTRNI
ncbi:CD82 antigen-like [Pyxicephalus adspersus]|uniref:CD82 antigen-like n=1 Tax=Pyxicephalus adspersus TaxID=30357 RepID=UPI003B5CD403